MASEGRPHNPILAVSEKQRLSLLPRGRDRTPVGRDGRLGVVSILRILQGILLFWKTRARHRGGCGMGITGDFARTMTWSGRVLFRILVAALLVASLLDCPAYAEKPTSPSIPALQKDTGRSTAEPPPDVLGRDTPFGTVLGFIKSAEREDLDRAAEYLEAQQIPKRARKLAQDLAAVLDAADLQDLTRNPEGDLGDGLPPNRERIGVVKTSLGSHEIFLERVQHGKEPSIWLFSADTLKWVPQVRGDLGVSPIERFLSGTFLDTRLLGYPLWRLIGMILVVPISYALARFVTGLLLPVIPVLFRRL